MATKSKIALVTGGSRGLGRDMAISLAKKGDNVFITYNSNKTEADKVVAEMLALGVKAEAFQLDVSSVASIDKLVSDVTAHLQEKEGNPNFDILVNNAGVGEYASIETTTEQQLDLMYAVHLKAPYLLTQKLLPCINNGGSIVNISSGLTRVTSPNVSAYASMKGALEIYTKCLAKELGSRYINCNVVAPGATATDFAGGLVKTNQNKINEISSNTALGRVGKPEDIGSVVAFLCSDDAKWINAQRIEVAGGFHI